MSLMLLAIIASTAMGLGFKSFGRRESAICAGVATALTLIYYFRPMYMT
jgi:hypothetical protein